MVKIKLSIQEVFSTWASARTVLSNRKYSCLYNVSVDDEILSNLGIGVGLASQISFHPPLETFDGFMLRYIECVVF